MSKKALKNYQTAMSQVKGHKVLHKVRKHWVTISLFALGLAGGTLLANTNASANAIEPSSNHNDNAANYQNTKNQTRPVVQQKTTQAPVSTASRVIAGQSKLFHNRTDNTSNVTDYKYHVKSDRSVQSINPIINKNKQNVYANSSTAIEQKANQVHSQLFNNTMKQSHFNQAYLSYLKNNPQLTYSYMHQGNQAQVLSNSKEQHPKLLKDEPDPMDPDSLSDELYYQGLHQSTNDFNAPDYVQVDPSSYSLSDIDPRAFTSSQENEVSVLIFTSPQGFLYNMRRPITAQQQMHNYLASGSEETPQYTGNDALTFNEGTPYPSGALIYGDNRWFGSFYGYNGWLGEGARPGYWIPLSVVPYETIQNIQHPQVTDVINYTVNGNIMFSNSITDNSGKKVTISQVKNHNSQIYDYHVITPQTFSYDGQTHDVAIAPNVQTDQIHYVLSGTNIPSNYQGSPGQLGSASVTGNPGTSISQDSYTNVPANYHIIGTPSLTYDGREHDIQIAPNSENLNITYTDQNGRTYAGAINGSYDQKINDVTSEYSLPNGYHLNGSQDASYVFNGNTNQNKSLSISGNQQNSSVQVTIQKYDGSTPEGSSIINVSESGLTGNSWTIDPNQYAPAGYHAQQGVLHGTFTPNGISQNNATFTYSAQAGSAITVNYINQDGNRVGGGSIPGNVDDRGSITNKLQIPSGYNINGGQDISYHITASPQAPITIHLTGNDSSQIPGNGTFNMTVQKSVGGHIISSTQQQVHVPGRVGDAYTITPSNYTPTGYTSTSNPIQGDINANGISSNSATFVYTANAGTSINVTYKKPNGQVVTSGQVKGLVDSTGNVYNSVPMPRYYHFDNANVSGANSSNVNYHITTNPQDIVITVSPDQATDTINFDYNGQQLASHQHTGDNVNANGASDTSINDASEVPAGWHAVSGTTFNYDGGAHAINLQPDIVTETINYQDTGDNRQEHNYIGNQGSHTFMYNDDRATAAGNNNLQILANSKPVGLNSDFHVVGTQTFSHDNGSYTETVYVARDTVNDNVNYVATPTDGNSAEDQHAHLLGSTPETLYADADYDLNDVASTLSVPDNNEIATPKDLTTAFHTQLLGLAPQDVNLPVFNLNSLEDAIADSTAAKYTSMNQSIAANTASETNETNSTNAQVNSINARFQAEKASEARAETSQANSAKGDITSLVNDLKNNSGASQAVRNNPSANAALGSYESQINSLLSDMQSNPANAGDDMHKIIELETKTNTIVSSASTSASVSADISSVNSSADSANSSMSTAVTNVTHDIYTSAAAQSTADSKARSQQSSEASSMETSIINSASSTFNSMQNSIAASATAQSVADSLKRSAAESSATSQMGSMTSSIASSASAQSIADSTARSQASSAASSSVSSLDSSIVASLDNHDSANVDSQASQANSTADQAHNAINVDSLASGVVNSLEAELVKDQSGEASAKAAGNASAANSYADDASKAASGIDSAAASAETSSTISSVNKSNATSVAANDSANVNSYASGADSMASNGSDAVNNDPNASNAISGANSALNSEKAAAASALASGDTSLANSLAAEASAEASMIDSAVISAETAASNIAHDSSNMGNDAANAADNLSSNSSAVNTDPLAQSTVNSAQSAISSAESAEKAAARNGNTSAADSYAALVSEEASAINSAIVSANTALSNETEDANNVSNYASHAMQNAAADQNAIDTDPAAKNAASSAQSALQKAQSAEVSAKATGNTSAADSYATDALENAADLRSAAVSAENALSAETNDANAVSDYVNHASNDASSNSNAINMDPSAKAVVNSAQQALTDAQSAEQSAKSTGNTSAADSYANKALEEANDMQSAAISAANVLSAEESAANVITAAGNGAASMSARNHSALVNDPTANSIANSAADVLKRDKASEAIAQAAGNTSAADSYATDASQAASMIDSAATSADLISSANASEASAVDDDIANAGSAVRSNQAAIHSDQDASNIISNADSALANDHSAENFAKINGNTSAAASYATAASTEASMIESAAASASTIASEEANDVSNVDTDMSNANNAVAGNYDAINNDPEAGRFIAGDDTALKHDKSAVASAKAKGNISAADSYTRDAAVRASAINSAAVSATDVANTTGNDSAEISADADNASATISSAQGTLDVDPAADDIVSDAHMSLDNDQSNEQKALDNGNVSAANSYATDASKQASTIDSAAVSAAYEASAGDIDLANITQDSSAITKDEALNKQALSNDPAASNEVSSASSIVNADTSLAISAKDAGNLSTANSYALAASSEASVANSAVASAETSFTGSVVSSAATNDITSLSGNTSVSFHSEDNRASAMYNDMNRRTDSLDSHIITDSQNAASVEVSNTDSLNNSVSSMSSAFNQSLYDASMANAQSFATESEFASASASEALSMAQSTAAKDGTSSAQSALAVAKNSINAEHSTVLSMMATNQKMDSASLAFAQDSASNAVQKAQADADKKADSLDRKIDTNASGFKGYLATMAKSANATDRSIRANIWALQHDKANASDVKADIHHLANNESDALHLAQSELSKKIGNVAKVNGANNAMVKDQLLADYQKLQHDMSQKADWQAIGRDEHRLNELAGELGSKANLTDVEVAMNQLVHTNDSIKDQIHALHDHQKIVNACPQAIYDIDSLASGQSGIYHSQLVTRKNADSHFRYIILRREVALHTDPNFHYGTTNGILKPSDHYTIHLDKILVMHRKHGGNLVRYEITYRHHHYFITGTKAFSRNSYVQPRDFSGHRHTVHVIRGAIIYNSPHYSKGTRISLAKPGMEFHVYKIIYLGDPSDGMTRLYIGHGLYVTANLNFVRVD